MQSNSGFLEKILPTKFYTLTSNNSVDAKAKLDNTQSAFTFSKTTTETSKQYIKSVQN